jgi:XTP/dITP diphosphohydrolase
MKKLLIATTNPGKFAEIKKYLSDLPLTFVSPRDLHIDERPNETGKTFEENAIIKLKFYLELSGLPTIADDGGFEIDALGGAPGVRSHRWIYEDRDNSDEELIAYALMKMKSLPQAKRGAQLRVVLAFAVPNQKDIVTVQERVRGVVADKPSVYRTRGFPYRSLLFLPELGKFYEDHELTKEENEAYNHRRKALEKLKPTIKRLLISEG